MTIDLFNMTLKYDGHKVWTLVKVVFKFQVGTQVKYFQMIEGKIAQKIAQKLNEHHSNVVFKINKVRRTLTLFCLEKFMSMIYIILIY